MLKKPNSGIDLVIIHREGVKGKGAGAALGLISQVKSDAQHATLPIVMTTDEWAAAECLKHQQSEQGVNAYISESLTEEKLVATIEAVLGQKIPKRSEKGHAGDPLGASARASGFALDLISINDVFDSEASQKILSEFNLEAPIISNSPPPFEGSTSVEAPLQIETIGEASSQKSEVPAAPSPSLETKAGTPVPEAKSPAHPIDFAGGIDIGLDLSMPDAELETRPAPPPGALMEDAPTSEPEVSGSPSTGPAPSLEMSLPDEPQSSFEGDEVSAASPDFTLPAEPLDSVAFGSPPPPLETQVGEISSIPLMQPDDQSHLNISTPEPSISPEVDPQAEEEMPYLYQRKVQPLIYGALGDAVIPGGAAQSPDVETIKKYLLLREQDVAVLSSQLKEARDQLALSERQAREERAKGVELFHLCQEQKKKIEEDEARRSVLSEKFEGELQELRFQLRTKMDQAKVLEAKVQQFSEEMDQLKERVRVDIRKIRVRERELENRLEMTRRDSEALLTSREAKLIELKRNLDLIEFNMDLLQNQYSKEKEISSQLREKVSKLAQVVRIADGLLETSARTETVGIVTENENLERKKVS